MKKVFFIVCLFFGLQVLQSQVQFGIKGGVNYNSESIEEVGEDIFSGAKSKTGYHAGIWFQGKLPVFDLFIRPEIIYTQLSNSVAYSPTVGVQTRTTTYNFRKIDLPILVGTKLFNVARIFAGPSFQYILDADFDLDDITDVKADGFSLGIQYGIGIDLGDFGIDVRWERSLSDTESSFVDNNIGNVNFDTRVNQIIVGLSYKL